MNAFQTFAAFIGIAIALASIVGIVLQMTRSPTPGAPQPCGNCSRRDLRNDADSGEAEWQSQLSRAALPKAEVDPTWTF